MLLLSGAGGRPLNDLGIETTPLRILGTTTAAYRSGLVARTGQRNYPVFDGLGRSAAVLRTSLGGNALADSYGIAGPTGRSVLLAEGAAWR